MLQNSLQCTGHATTTKKSPAQNVHSADVEKPWRVMLIDGPLPKFTYSSLELVTMFPYTAKEILQI